MTFRNLKGYKLAFKLAMEVFEISKGFPKEERFELTSQIRHSSRSVCSNISEAYRKRIYHAHFISKSSDADTENSETQVWLDFALACNYINQNLYEDLLLKYEEVGRLINHMVNNPDKYLTLEEKQRLKK